MPQTAENMSFFEAMRLAVTGRASEPKRPVAAPQPQDHHDLDSFYALQQTGFRAMRRNVDRRKRKR